MLTMVPAPLPANAFAAAAASRVGAVTLTRDQLFQLGRPVLEQPAL